MEKNSRNKNLFIKKVRLIGDTGGVNISNHFWHSIGNKFNWLKIK